MSVYEKMTAIADTIRSCLGTEDLLTLDDMPGQIWEVDSNAWSFGYTEGESAGFSDGMAEGFAQGEQAEYDRFWDIMQDNGKRANYNYAFSGIGWLDSTYNPKYPIAPTACTQLYYSSKITDTKVPIDLTKTGSNHTYLFTYCNNLVTINKLIVNETRKFTDTFASCTALKNITIEGTIGRDINLQWSPLTVESIISVISHLYCYSGGTYDGKYTITLSEDCWESIEAWYAENTEEANGIFGGIEGALSMKNYVQYDMGWNIG